MSNLEEPFKYMRGDYCYKCKKERAIEMYDVNNNPLNYSLFLDRYENNLENLDKVYKNKNISYMKCMHCNTMYAIDFSHKKVMPLYDLSYILSGFLNNLKE